MKGTLARRPLTRVSVGIPGLPRGMPRMPGAIARGSAPRPARSLTLFKRATPWRAIRVRSVPPHLRSHSVTTIKVGHACLAGSARASPGPVRRALSPCSRAARWAGPLTQPLAALIDPAGPFVFGLGVSALAFPFRRGPWIVTVAFGPRPGFLGDRSCSELAQRRAHLTVHHARAPRRVPPRMDGGKRFSMSSGSWDSGAPPDFISSSSPAVF